MSENTGIARRALWRLFGGATLIVAGIAAFIVRSDQAPSGAPLIRPRLSA